MLRKTSYILLILALSLGLATMAYAQQGRGMSGNGGSFGGPGMAGATGNGLNSFSGGVPSGAGGERPTGGELPAGGGRPAGGEWAAGGRFGSGERPSLPSGTFDQGRSGEWFGGAEGLKSRLNRAREEGMSWAEFGGFGVGAASDVTPPQGAPGELSGQWNPLSDELPTAPSAMESIDAVIAAQKDAIAQATAEAQAQAQAAYDQFWANYYAAVGYAADAYLEAVVASVDEAYALYMDALNQTVAAIDYTLDYAAEYAEYCYYYPWDCYSYVYDETTGAYQNVEANSDQPAGEVTVGEVTAEATWPDTLDAPASSAEAYEALVVFASSQLGLVVQPLYAGALTEDIVLLIQQVLPDELQAYAALLASAQAYWGIVTGGVGAVAVGDCSAETPCAPGDIPAALSDAAAGVYALRVAQTMPADAAGALDLITTVFPALNGLAFAQVADVETGLAFMATAYGVGVDADDHPVTVAKLIYAGVTPVEGQTVVYAMVAVGEAEIEAFYSLFAD